MAANGVSTARVRARASLGLLDGKSSVAEELSSNNAVLKEYLNKIEEKNPGQED